MLAPAEVLKRVSMCWWHRVTQPCSALQSSPGNDRFFRKPTVRKSTFDLVTGGRFWPVLSVESPSGMSQLGQLQLFPSLI
jgi:hypothetical protein